MIAVLKKVLNPFAISITSPGKLYIYLGILATAALHVAFYGTLVHFILKAW